MYYIECPVDRSDSIGIFLDLISRGHLRFYGVDTPGQPEVITFRVCLPEVLKYGFSSDLVSSSYRIYNPKYACYINIDDFHLVRDSEERLRLTTSISSIWWDPGDEKFVSYPIINWKSVSFTERLRLGEILRYLGLPKEFFKEYYNIWQQAENDEYIFETTSDIWK
jgi:hypothetical protein